MKLAADLILFTTIEPSANLDGLSLDKVLLVKRKYPPYEGCWVFPGGMMDEGETFKEAALRETQEETGIKVSDAYILTLLDNPDRDPRGRVISAVYAREVFETRTAITSDETPEVKWVDAKDIIDGNIQLGFDHIKAFDLLIDKLDVGEEYF